MNRLGTFAYVAAIAAIVLITWRDVIYPGAFLYGELPLDRFALGVAGWSIATLGPLSLSLWVWRLSKRLNPKWVLHLLFLPCAFAVWRTGESILFFAAGEWDSDTMGGRTLDAAVGFLAVALLVYAIALVALAIGAIIRRARAS